MAIGLFTPFASRRRRAAPPGALTEPYSSSAHGPERKRDARKSMKISTILPVAAAPAALISDGLAANYDDLVKKGYRWVNSDCPMVVFLKNDLEQILGMKRGTVASTLDYLPCIKEVGRSPL